MTRINCGILPEELCDKHLLAEYRELPRMQPMAAKRYAKYKATGPRPMQFTLGTGHMAFFLPFGGYLKTRWDALLLELVYRGFRPKLTWRQYPFELFGFDLSAGNENIARMALIERINLRFLTAKKKPVWTKRKPPKWAIALKERNDH